MNNRNLQQSISAYKYVNTYVREKQTYIPKICSIILQNSIDIRKSVRYNTNIQNKRFDNLFDRTEAANGRMYMSNYYNGRREYCRVYSMTASGRSRKKGIIAMCCLFTIVLVIMIISIRHIAFADESGSKNITKQYSSVIIHCGDTVDSISEKCASSSIVSIEKYRNEIMACNHLSEDTRLIPGNYIIVPEYEYSLVP